MDLINEVLERIKPTDEENLRIKKAVEDIITKINENIHNLMAEPILVGSVAKGTHLKNPDIDIFIRFSTSYERNFIETFTLELGKKILENPVINYAEHPYVNGKYNGFDFDIVPCYYIEDSFKKITAVDRTPFHTKFVLEHLSDDGKDQVRILKQFLKGIGIYGAEAKVQGFSGYLTELLIIKYGTFENVLKEAESWRKFKIITFKDHGKNLYEKFKAPLIFIDPVDENRNVASALSLDNYSKFIHASKEFLKERKINFFFPEIHVPEKMPERNTKILHLILPRPELVDDVLYPQIRKFATTVFRNLDEFQPMDYHFYVDNFIHIIIESYFLDLPDVMVHEGPPVWDKNSENFIKKWINKCYSGPYIKDGHFYAYVERKYNTMEKKILNIVEKNSIGKDLDRIKNKLKFSRDINTIDKKELYLFMRKKFPWEY
ncbi:MAG: CCA tRNA nucleotidyltransferase [Thermoplasmata archaeon]|nr:CCA tRNA nucleotidyltransferase [Thermoplasmata archaeon]